MWFGTKSHQSHADWNFLFFFLFLNIGELIPHYFYVPKIYLEKERKEPHSQVRLPSNEDGGLFLWGQSLLIIMNLLCNTYNWNYHIVERLSLYCSVLVFSLLDWHKLAVEVHAGNIIKTRQVSFAFEKTPCIGLGFKLQVVPVRYREFEWPIECSKAAIIKVIRIFRKKEIRQLLWFWFQFYDGLMLPGWVV